QAGNLDGQEFTRDIHDDVKAIRKSNLLNVEILLQKIHFLSQCDYMPVGSFDDTAQKVTQPCDHVYSSIISFFAHQAGDGIERVEKKVRLDLPPQGIQLRFRKLLVKAGGLRLLERQSLPGVHNIADGENRAIEKEGGQQSVVELVKPQVHKRWGTLRICPGIE